MSNTDQRSTRARRSKCLLLVIAQFIFAASLIADTVLSENFEGVFPGSWSVGDANNSGTTAYWKDVNLTSFGTPPIHGTGSYAGYCAGVGYGGTSANPTYQNSMGAFLSRSINLAGYSAASISFWHVIPSIEAGNFDKCRVFIDNTMVFERSAPVTSWTQVTIDLSSYVGGSHTLEFDFISDTSGVNEGWYIDDILVTASVSQPDLAKVVDSLSNLSPAAGETVTAALTLTNHPCAGTPSAGPFHVGFYWSTTSTFSGVTPFYEASVTGCAANASTVLNQAISIDATTAPGTYYLGYKIDDQGEVAECNENNNGIFYWTVIVQATPADLMPKNISVTPDPAIINGTVTVNYAITNQGGTSAPASHTKIQIKNASNVLLVEQTFSTVTVAGGASVNESRSLSLSGASPGTYYAYVIVDNNSEVSQSDYTNDYSTGISFSVQAASGLIINPIFDSTITTHPAAAKIQSAIYAAISVYQSKFSDPVTVNIRFAGMATGLGQSQTYYGTIAYSDYIAALQAHAKTTNDIVALAYLPAGPANPVNGGASIKVTTANLRILGGTIDPPPGEADSTISLNFGLMNLDRITIDPNKYDVLAVLWHETDEVLGMLSELNGLNNGDPSPTAAVRPMDLFRYDQNGFRSFNTLNSAQAYFSMDGVYHLARFNQKEGGDFQDFYSTGLHTPEVQDAFGTPGATSNLGVELVALDIIGLDLATAAPVPKLRSVNKVGNNVSISWDAMSGRSYQLQFKTNLTQSAWTDLGSTITASTSVAISTDVQASDRQRFYRVQLLQSTPIARGAKAPFDFSNAPVSIATSTISAER